jgi:hypothetical protein
MIWRQAKQQLAARGMRTGAFVRGVRLLPNRRLGGTIALVLFLGVTPELVDSQLNTRRPRSTTEESRRVLEGFARLLYVQRNVTAMTRYFDAHLIQHDAEIADGGHGDDAFLERRRKLQSRAISSGGTIPYRARSDSGAAT